MPRWTPGRHRRGLCLRFTQGILISTVRERAMLVKGQDRRPQQDAFGYLAEVWGSDDRHY